MRLALLAGLTASACSYSPSPATTGSVDGPMGDASGDTIGNLDANRVAVRINVRGPEVVGVSFPGTWVADPGTTCTGTSYLNATEITGTVDDPLFQYQLNSGSPIVCAVGSLPSGSYVVRLLFAEIFRGANCPGGVGERSFDIELEGTVVLANFAMTAEGNGCAAGDGGMPVAKAFTLPIVDGTLDIRLLPVALMPMLAAIEVVSQ